MNISYHIGFIVGLGLSTAFVAFGVLWLLFKFYLTGYEMDLKSMAALSLKTFGTFVLISFGFAFLLPEFAATTPAIIVSGLSAFGIAYWLFKKAGMDKKEALKTAMFWFVAVFVISWALQFLSALFQ